MVQNDKTSRMLYLYEKLLRGGMICKTQEAQRFHVSNKSIQRDIEDMRAYLSDRQTEEGVENNIIYDQKHDLYYLERAERISLSNAEVLAIAKILLDSRAFTKEEMDGMLESLIACCVPPENQKLVRGLVGNEQFHYVEPKHGRVFIDKMWEIGNAIYETRYIEITYQKINGEQVTRIVQPQAILFSEYYFYLAAYIDNIDREKEFDVPNDTFPTIYRIDRIQELKVSDRHFKIPYKDRFEEGEYRKRIQFMFGGRLQKITFWYKGQSIEAVQDRLPTARVYKREGKYLVKAETFGSGIEMWLRSQGDLVEVVERA